MSSSSVVLGYAKMIQEQETLRAIFIKYSLFNTLLKSLATVTGRELGLSDGTITYVGKSTIPDHTNDDIFLITIDDRGQIGFYVEGGVSMLRRVAYIESPIDSRIKFIPEIASAVPVVSSSGGASRRRKAKRHGKQRRTRRRTYRRLGRRF